MKRIIDSLSWKNIASRPRFIIKMVLVAPFVKLFMDFYDRNIRMTQARVYRASTVFGTARNPSNPPAPAHYSDDWESEEVRCL